MIFVFYSYQQYQLYQKRENKVGNEMLQQNFICYKIDNSWRVIFLSIIFLTILCTHYAFSDGGRNLAGGKENATSQISEKDSSPAPLPKSHDAKSYETTSFARCESILMTLVYANIKFHFSFIKSMLL